MSVFAEVLRIAGQGGYPCLFHIITGAYCPGCGGTRAAVLLLHGKIIESICYNPLVLYMAVAIPLFLLYFLMCRKKKKRMSQRLWNITLCGGIFIAIANFLIKNYFLLYRHADILKMLDQITGV